MVYELNKFYNGTAVDANEVNQNIAKPISLAIINKIAMDINAATIASVNKDDIFSDSYISNTGRNSTVNTTDTTATYDATDDVYEVSTSAIATSGTTQSENFTSSTSTTKIDTIMQPRFTANSDMIVTTFKFRSVNQNGVGLSANTFYRCTVERYDTVAAAYEVIAQKYFTTSNTTSEEDVTFTFGLHEYTGIINNTEDFRVEIKRIAGTGTLASYSTGGVAEFTGGTLMDHNPTASGDMSKYPSGSSGTCITATGITTGTTPYSFCVIHDIPTGTMPDDVQTLMGKALIYQTDSTSKIFHRLKNSTEDSGWWEDGETGKFTAFTTEPTEYWVKLQPASSSPTATYPTIKGAGVVFSH